MFCPRCGSQVDGAAPFCTVCGAPQTPGAPMAMTAPVNARLDKALATKWIGDGWNMASNNLGILALETLIFGVIAGSVPMILHGPLVLGMQYTIMRKMVHGRCEVGDLFKGFNVFVPLMVAGVLISFFTGVGYALCLIPGFFVSAMLQFPLLLIFDKGMDFWPAIQKSYEVCQRDLMGYTWFVLLQTLVIIAGALCCGVGLLVAVPVVEAAVVAAYADVFGFEQRTVELSR